MKFTKMQITGFGYINNATITKNKSIIVIHLKNHENDNEDVWLNCTTCSEIANFVKDKLLDNLKQGHAVLIKFCASYEKFSEAFYAMDDSKERIVVFNAKLSAIKSVFVNGSYKSIN